MCILRIIFLLLSFSQKKEILESPSFIPNIGKRYLLWLFFSFCDYMDKNKLKKVRYFPNADFIERYWFSITKGCYSNGQNEISSLNSPVCSKETLLENFQKGIGNLYIEDDSSTWSNPNFPRKHHVDINRRQLIWMSRETNESSRSYNNSFPVPQLLVVPDKANTNRGRNSKLMPIDLFLQIATPTWSVHRFPSHFLSKFIWGFLWYLLSIFDSTFLIYSYMSLIYICSMSLQYFPGYSRFQIYVSVYPDIISADYSKENNLKRIMRKK